MKKDKNMGGLANICKLYGSMKVQAGGKKVTWLWDYVNDKPRLEGDMTNDEIKASEKAKWEKIRNERNRNIREIKKG